MLTQTERQAAGVGKRRNFKTAGQKDQASITGVCGSNGRGCWGRRGNHVSGFGNRVGWAPSHGRDTGGAGHRQEERRQHNGFSLGCEFARRVPS